MTSRYLLPAPMRRCAASSLVAVATLGSACGADTPDEEPGELRLVAGATSVMWETILWRDFGIIGDIEPHVGVADAVASGQDVYVVVQNAFGPIPTLHGEPVCRGECEAIRPQTQIDGPTATQWLLASHDGGRTWAMTEFEPPTTVPEPFIFSWDVAFWVHPDGDGIIQVPTARDDHSAWGFYTFDPMTAAATEHPVLGQSVLDYPVRAVGPLISGWSETFYGTDRWFNALHYDTRDGTFHKEVTGEPVGVQVPGGPRPSAVTTTSADGQLWWSFYIDGYGSGCVGWARPAEFSEPQRGPCVGRELLPRQLREPVGVHAFRSGAVGALGHWRDHVWAMPLPTQPDRPLAPNLLVDLGPGSAVRDVGFHAEFGGALAIAAPEGMRYVDLGWDGTVQELLFPPDPCAGGPCGDSVWLERALPLPFDRWLLIYTVDVAPGTDRQMKIVAYETAVERRPYVAERLDLPEATSPLASYPEARPAVALARACQARVACTGQRYYDCVSEWEQLYEGCEALEAFLNVDTSADDVCDRIGALRPDAACSGRPAPDARACASQHIECDGDRIVSCLGTPAEIVRQCELLGLTCEEQRDGVRCVSRAPVEDVDCGLMTPYRVECLGGRYLSWCQALDERQWIDCEELGFAGCAPTEFGDAACSDDIGGGEGVPDDIATASAIEERCWGEVTCLLEDAAIEATGYASRAEFHRCVRRWTSVVHASDARVDAFEAVSPTDCAALRDVDPHGFPPPFAGTTCDATTGCYDEALPTCARVPPFEGYTAWCPLDVGADCSIDARGRGGCMDDTSSCPAGDDAGGCDAQGRAYDCGENWKIDCAARGLGCVEGTGRSGLTTGRCADPSWTCQDAGLQCAGDVSVNCAPTGLPTDATDCTRISMVCGDAGYCEGPGLEATLGDPAWGAPRCQDGLLLWASYGKRSFDCTALDGNCASDANGAWCQR